MSRRHPGPARQRSATESLLSIVLALEAAVIFFTTLVVFALDVLSPAVAFSGGAILFLVLLAVGRMLRHPLAVWAGWLLQLVLIGMGVLVPVMYLIGAGFTGLWIYCFVTGTRLDRRNAKLRGDTTGTNTTSTEAASTDAASTDTNSTDTKETTP